jgi:hypothetical protein
MVSSRGSLVRKWHYFGNPWCTYFIFAIPNKSLLGISYINIRNHSTGTCINYRSWTYIRDPCDAQVPNSGACRVWHFWFVLENTCASWLTIPSTNSFHTQNAYICHRMPHEHPAVRKSQLPAHRAVEFRPEQNFFYLKKKKVPGPGSVY